MNVPWNPVVFVDISGSLLMLLISAWCAVYSWHLAKKRADDVFRNYLYLFMLAILFFAVSRSFGHLFKQLLLLNDMTGTWKQIAPYSGAVNSVAFVVIFALSLYFNRFQKVHSEIERYKDNLEDMIATRTEELETAKNTLENILDNSNPINITTTNFDLMRANEAYYSLWPTTGGNNRTIKCYDSRPGEHCHTDSCPLKLIIEGQEEVVQEVSKKLNGDTKDFIITARPFRAVDGTLIGMVESFQDITLRKQAERAMSESEERFRKIFESNPDPVILAKLEDGTIIDVNREFETATGISRQEALGRNSDQLGLWEEHSFREAFRQRLRSEGEVNNFEATFRVTDGNIKTGLMSGSLLTVNNETCILLVIRDITTEKAAERTLIEMDRMKSEFISTAAHELNTPLSTMMGYTEFLRDPEAFGDFTEEQKKDFINEVYENGEALSRIIEDLLDISRIESGKPIPLVLQETNILEMLRKKVKTYQTHNTGHTFHLELPEAPKQPNLVIDRHRINQALENLLSNAVKYSHKNTEILLVGKETEAGWEIRVKDQGIGMNTEQLARIFDKFYRADASNTATKGLGLGMSIVKQSIEAHGGNIHVTSDVNKGTVVTFFLPYRAA